ncbi:MAG: trypsin-like peptidase domain-containing protein [Deltaproteobacteria bacterium]|nr:trypsin-like peptidase domain-containing protein [Deltaproteobacteria bacterium]
MVNERGAMSAMRMARPPWKRWLTVGVFLAAAAGLFSSGVFSPPPHEPVAVTVAQLAPPGSTNSAPQVSNAPPTLLDVATPGEMRGSIAPLVERVEHAVVAIQSTKIIRRVVREPPLMEYLRERMGGRAPTREDVQRGLGSGFIINPTGVVLTNNHVVAGADEVEVLLDDGRKLAALVVGSDPTNDVAVVKIIKPPTDLRAANLGNSDAVRVGDYVVAIGNPLGLGKTVTMGIVSAKHRSLGTSLGDVPEQYQDFIQTDAAINQGNSGGPLFDFSGRVIGVNSAILNPAVAMNVGFAIPINLAMQIAGQLQRSGRVSRGFLGVQTEDLSHDNASALGTTQKTGSFVASVVPGSPAAKAGIRAGDVLTEIGGRKLDRKNALAQAVATLLPGAPLVLKGIRGAQTFEVKVVLDERASGVEMRVLDIVVTPLSANEARDVGLNNGQGVRVVYVNPRGPTSGELRDGDIIMGVNRTIATVEVLQQFEKALLRGGSGRVTVQRDGQQLVITLAG